MLDAHIIKARPGFTVDVRLRLAAGERIALFGASGAGKSTVLSCLAGFETPDRGRIRLGDLQLFPPNLPLHRRPLGYLSQSDLLFPHLSVAQNICFGLTGRPHNGWHRWVEELKQHLRLAAFWDQPARRLSGGQARRVALARMLARRPPLILLDEPFTALDRPTTEELIGALMRWQSELGFSLVAVDHRADILDRLCARAIIIEAGRLVQEDRWHCLRARPATPLLASLLGVE